MSNAIAKPMQQRLAAALSNLLRHTASFEGVQGDMMPDEHGRNYEYYPAVQEAYDLIEEIETQRGGSEVQS